MSSDSTRVQQTAGVLYIVATPIGNLEDLSARAIETLKKVDVVAAEDTRHSRRLLQHLGLRKTMLALHEHNERERSDGVLDLLEKGSSIALVSDAGTPLISDPGYVLVREARSRGLVVTPIPGACALIAALSAAGLPTDRFRFEGFLPAKRGARRAALEALKHEVATLVFYESPHRILETAAEIAETFGDNREVVFGRELTKAFETFYAGAAAEVSAQLAADPYAVKGEFVVMVHGATQAPEEGVNLDVDLLLRLLTVELPVKKVARMAADLTGLSKNELYQRALDIKDA